MLSLGKLTRINVLTAIRDHDLQGAAEFREALGFESLGDELLVERGKRYDARALLSYAHGKATGDYPGPDQVTTASLKVLTDLGFKVSTGAELDRAKAAPATRTRAPRSAPAGRATTSRTKPEPVVRLCPTCFTQLAVTGSCDFCD
ncbi:MAG: hypothetical protein ACJ72D_22340 [Marmoricola sp.]